MISEPRGWSARRALAGCAALAGCLALAGCAALESGTDELQGVIELHERQLGFEQAGRLRSLAVHRGQRVAAGEVLGSLDDALERPLREGRAGDQAMAAAQLRLLLAGTRVEDVQALEAQVRAARAVEDTLRDNVARTRKLREASSVPPSQLDEVEGQLKRAKAEREAVEQRLLAARHGARADDVRAAAAREHSASAALALADERLARLVLRAPEAGVILDTHAEPGEVLGMGAPLVTLGEPRRPYADLFVPEARAAAVRQGAKVSLRLDGVAEVFSGVVEDIGRRTEFAPRFLYSPKERPNLVVRVRVDIADPGERLRAGLPVMARIEESQAARSGPGEGQQPGKQAPR